MGEDKTQAYYDGISKGYKELYHEEQKQKISLLLNYLPKKEKVLDLGSGDGVLNEFLSNKTKLTSFDLSQELLNLNPNKNKVQGSVTNLPFKNNQFDSTISLTMIQDVENTQKAIEEISRVTKNNLILTFLKMSSKRDEIIKNIQKYFNIQKEIEETKDLILICTK